MVTSGIKIEVGELTIKDLILDSYFPGINKDDFECYFYLDEEGSPRFVVEQK